MPINFPSLKNLVDRTRSDVRNQLPDSDPTVFGSFVRAFSDSLASRAFDLVLLIEQSLEQFFPQTATGEFIERWAGYDGLTRLAATPGVGNVIFEGTAGTAIPINTILTSTTGELYTTQAGVSIATNVFNITTLTRNGTTATATAAGHPLASGVTLTVAGANEAEYNGSFVITVIDANTFTYEVTGTPATPATGTITGTIDNIRVLIQSQNNGQALNLDSGASVTLQTPIANVNSISFVTFDGIAGGTDDETDDLLRARVLDSRANPVANFNEGAIVKQAKKIAGVTSVFVKKITPNIGDVTIFFLRENDVNPLPSASEITAVKDSILLILPATSDENNVIVQAPTFVTTDYVFSAISPDTPTMRTSIGNSLKAFYEDKVKFETDITQDQYRAAIIETQDTETGIFLDSFTLSAPAGDISITTGEIGNLGTVTFT
ncbi:MAG: baseplate J/gp47 family protein [Candidatus Anammoxibacter sp.]